MELKSLNQVARANFRANRLINNVNKRQRGRGYGYMNPEGFKHKMDFEYFVQICLGFNQIEKFLKRPRCIREKEGLEEELLINCLAQPIADSFQKKSNTWDKTKSYSFNLSEPKHNRKIMDKAQNYIEINRQSWNIKTETHVKSAFYDNDNFLKGKTSLNAFELDLLGDVTGKKILHLQCHFGQDSISLSRLGAVVTGVDLSDKAIDTARQIATDINADAQFICCDIYDLPNHLSETFDVVFTSYGAIGWLPDLDKWASVVSRFLKPNGQFVMVEFHPMVWMFDNNFEKIAYSYFNTGAIIETEIGTYAEKNANITTEFVSWNHSLGEVINSLINTGLEINTLNEYDYSPYNCFNNTIEFEPGKYRIEQLGKYIPIIYAIAAKKKANCEI